MVRIAVEGCGHGNLDIIYDAIKDLDARSGTTTELLLACGDFQCPRNLDDMNCLVTPLKYRRMGDFVDYYTGKKTAPVMTIFVGGNHEASNYLWELYHGGWVAPNMYYLGHAGVVTYRGLRIGGISGIHHDHHANTPYTECVPYTSDTERSAYHMRMFEVNRILSLSGQQPLDVFLTHDWPQGVLETGNPLTQDILKHKPPRYWFAGHMHRKYAAVIQGKGKDVEPTKFLALSKPLQSEHFIQSLDIEPKPSSSPSSGGLLEYDVEWLAITRITNQHIRDTSSFSPSSL
eukprot:PhF_6_TR31403/c0_g1_i2/m.46014/K18328/DBR1; lariat debranching enzyme